MVILLGGGENVGLYLAPEICVRFFHLQALNVLAVFFFSLI